MSDALRRRLRSEGPKRVLALDGGGVRGILTLGYLSRIEALLRSRYGDPTFRLADYFDLVGGTSTGSIIAAAIAVGMEVEEIRSAYLRLAGRVFGRRRLRWWSGRFDERPLLEELERAFGDRTLADPSVGTGLCIVVKRVDTASTWPLLNHPDGRYFAENGRIRLRDAIRASTAAPTAFRPHRVEVARGEEGVFVDGAISTALNPAFLLFCVATLSGFPFRWPTGDRDLLLVSVGTGTWAPRSDPRRVEKGRLWDWATRVPRLLLHDGLWQTQLLLQYLSRSKTPWPIDAEVGDLSDDLLGPAPALEYVRYDAILEAEALSALGRATEESELGALRDMTNADAREDLDAIALRFAARDVQGAHFPPAFDRGVAAGARTRRP